MIKIVGIRVHRAEVDGKPYMGYWLYYTNDYPAEALQGITCGAAYLRERVSNSCGYAPVVGDEVKMKVERGKNGTPLVKWIYPQ